VQPLQPEQPLRPQVVPVASWLPECADKALRIAAASGDAVALRAVLPQAILGGAQPELLEWAFDKCQELEHEAWAGRMRCSASQTLEEMLVRKDARAEWLAAAQDRAFEANVQGDLLARAREEIVRRQACQAAEEALLLALAERSALADALTQAVSCAEKAGVDVELLRYARRRLEDLQQYARRVAVSSKAEQSLADLVVSGNGIAETGAVVEEAQKAGASRKTLERAWKRKVTLEAQEWQVQKSELAGQRLRLAMQAADPQELAGTLSYAIALGASEELVLRARQKQEGGCSGSSCNGGGGTDRARRSSDESRSSLNTSREPVASCTSSSRWTLPPRIPSSSADSALAVSRQQSHATTVLESVREKAQASRPASASEGSPKPMRLTSASPRPAPREDVPCYGLDAELKAKAAAKYDAQAEEDAARWVQAITGEEVVGDFFDALRSGQVLCQLVNSIRAGSVAKINSAGMPFKERENISNFLRVCRSLGVQEYALFSTDDLYEEKNLQSVVNCVHALGGAVQRSVPEFRGPHFGVADTSNAKRDSRRELGPASQTGGFHGPMERSHLDVVSNQIVRGGC